MFDSAKLPITCLGTSSQMPPFIQQKTVPCLFVFIVKEEKENYTTFYPLHLLLL
jgi:hypothetical protein